MDSAAIELKNSVVSDLDLVELQKKAKLADLLDRDRNHGKVFCDVTLTSGEKKCSVHKCIISCMSDYFEAMFRVEMKEKYENNVNIQSIPHGRLQIILQFLYTGHVPITVENVLNILQDADHAQLSALKTFCDRFVSKLVSPDNCLQLRSYAEMFNLSQVTEALNKVITNSFEKVIQTSEFQTLEVDEVLKVMQQRTKECPLQEKALFNAIVSWARREEQRERHFPRMFLNLVLTRMPLEFLSDSVAREDLVRKSLDCMGRVVDAIAMLSKTPIENSDQRTRTPSRTAPPAPLDQKESGSKQHEDIDSELDATMTKLRHQVAIANTLNNDRRLDTRFCDGMIHCQGKQFPVHKPVLCVMSPYLRTRYQQMTENQLFLSIDDISPERLENILTFIYTSDVRLTEDNVTEMLEDAKRFELPDAEPLCVEFLLEKISVNNFLKFWSCARQHELVVVSLKVNEVIAGNFAHVVREEEFLSLNVDDVIDIMRLRDKEIHEELIYKRLVQWVHYKIAERYQLFKKVFSELDLSCISEQVLKKHVANEDLVRKSTKCCHWVLDELSSQQTYQVSLGFLLIGGEKAARDCTRYDFLPERKRSLPRMNVERLGACAERLERKVFIVGGKEGTSHDWNFSGEVCDLDNQGWLCISNTFPIYNAASAVVDGCMYITGGFGSPQSDLSIVRSYDPERDEWMKLPDLSNSRSLHGMAAIGKSIYCIGGSMGDLTHCERYDTREGKWRSIAPLMLTRRGLTAVSLGGRVYSIGGTTDKAVEKYDPRADKWSVLPGTTKTRTRANSAVIAGKIFVLGGLDDEKPMRSSEFYDPRENCWYPGKSFGFHRIESCLVDV